MHNTEGGEKKLVWFLSPGAEWAKNYPVSLPVVLQSDGQDQFTAQNTEFQ